MPGRQRVVGREAWRESSLGCAHALLWELGVGAVEVDVGRLRLRVMGLVEERGWSPGRMVDLMHVLAGPRGSSAARG